MAKKRSPILGFNTNVKHRGRGFHVQTEDSGVDSPHIFTHLFNGGVIVASKREDYDPELDELAVKKLMQELHKSLLRELKKGLHNEKIDALFGPPPSETEELSEPAGVEATGAPLDAPPAAATAEAAFTDGDAEAPPRVEVPPLHAEPAALAAARVQHWRTKTIPPLGELPEGELQPEGRPVIQAGRVVVGSEEGDPSQSIWNLPVPGADGHPAPGEARPSAPSHGAQRPREVAGQGGAARPVAGRLPPPPRGVNRTPVPPSEASANRSRGAPHAGPSPGSGYPGGRPPAGSRPPAGAAAARPRDPRPVRPFGTPSADGVVIARPSVIVGSAGASPSRASSPSPPPDETAASRGGLGIFGESQERSLDEVILAYLTDEKE